MSVALDRQIRPIYDALDTGSNKSAIVACNKLLKKYPNVLLIKALKALALVRSNKIEESLPLADEILAARPTSDAVLTAMTLVLRSLARHKDTITMFEEAFKQQPNNEELGAQTFFANVRAKQWRSAQQVATKMHKQFKDERYVYWSALSAILQASDQSTPQAMKSVLYQLAHRLVTRTQTPSHSTADRFYLHLIILRELALYEEAMQLLESPACQKICATNLTCNEVRREIARLSGNIEHEGKRAQKLILEDKDRNWLEFLSVIDAVFFPLAPGQLEAQQISKEDAIVQSTARVTKAQKLFEELAEQDGRRDRSGLLALLELEQRAVSHGISADHSRLCFLLQRYFKEVGDKACCFEDLKPYIGLDESHLKQWISFLQSIPVSFNDSNELQRSINANKLLRFHLTSADIDVTAEEIRVRSYIKYYLSALPLGENLAPTELQPADDFALLAGNTFVRLWQVSSDDRYLVKAAIFLEFALTKSAEAFQIRLLLICIYRLIGAPSLALDHYRGMRVKQVQNDTLSHFILSRASTFSLAASGDLSFASECIEASQVHLNNAQETPEFIVRAFTHERYSQVPDFIVFEDRLDNSFYRDVIRIEHLRMRLLHEVFNSDAIDMELIELKFILDRRHYDNRDFEILANYQPAGSTPINLETLLFGKAEGPGWLHTFLKVYIRALQQASNLSEAVEERLLVGDRPKIETKDPVPLHERLLQRPAEELSDLTNTERAFVAFADSLANWLERYHDHLRPPSSVVLAHMTKQNGSDKTSSAGGAESTANGDAPPIIAPPALLSTFFDDMKTQFHARSPSENPSNALHIASLTQEALVLFDIETLRFRPASTAKVHKLGILLGSFKPIRAKAIETIKGMSQCLLDLASEDVEVKDYDTAKVLPEINHDFVATSMKRITESRKRVFDGVGKGMSKVCYLYAH